jgi:hypothetical protein
MHRTILRAGRFVVPAAIAFVFACATSDNEKEDDDEQKKGSGSTSSTSGSSGPSGSTGSSSGTDCNTACVQHETSCGEAAPEAACANLCSTYQPLAWQVDCAMQVECGDVDGLMACLPDLECASKCVAHEQQCGNPAPESDCQALCDEYRPTVAQVACAQAVECGDQQGLAACIAPPQG